MKKAYVQSYSIATPLGLSAGQNYNAIINGQSANKKTKFSFSDKEIVCSQFNDEVLEKKYVHSSSSNENLTRFEKIASLSIDNLLSQTIKIKNKQKTLFLLSTTKGNIELLEKNAHQIPAERVYLENTAKFLNEKFNLAVDVQVVSNACISGILAVWIAARYIQNEVYEQVIVCGCDTISEFTLAGFKSFNAISDSICKPYDKNRTGINLGEASACILLGNEAIGEKIEVVSGGSANDANHISGPSRTGEGLYLSIQECLQTNPNLKPGFISAHGTATEFNDEMESIALGRCGFQDIPVNSLKYFFGHTLGAAGVIETVLSFEALKHNSILPSGGFETAGTSSPMNLSNKVRSAQFNTFLKTASGFGGCNAAVLFQI